MSSSSMQKMILGLLTIASGCSANEVAPWRSEDMARRYMHATMALASQTTTNGRLWAVQKLVYPVCLERGQKSSDDVSVRHHAIHTGRARCSQDVIMASMDNCACLRRGGDDSEVTGTQSAVCNGTAGPVRQQSRPRCPANVGTAGLLPRWGWAHVSQQTWPWQAWATLFSSFYTCR